MSRAPTRPSRTRKQRERTVGRSRPSASAHRMIVTPAGGSSSVLSRADWASSFIRSADSMIATRAPPSTGISWSSPMRSLTPRARASDPPMTTCRPGPTGASRWRSGCPPCSTSRHARHARQGRSAGAAVHNSPAARSSARVVLPTPSGPTRSTAWGAFPRTMAVTAVSAAGCPLVLAPSIGERSVGQVVGFGRGRLAGRSTLRGRGDGDLGIGGAASSAAAAVSAGAAVALEAAVFRGARGLATLGAGASGSVPFTSDTSATATGASSLAAAALADGLRVARGLAAAAVVPAGLRAARVFGAGAAVSVVTASSAETDSMAATASTVSSITGDGACRLGAGFWATWARSIASSSGGTSLHGSFELRGAGGAERSTGRSPRLYDLSCALAACSSCGRALTSG